jgi:hypothetical protein
MCFKYYRLSIGNVTSVDPLSLETRRVTDSGALGDIPRILAGVPANPKPERRGAVSTEDWAGVN